MAEKTPEQVKKEPKVTIDESRSNPPVQGPSNIVKVSSKKGKILVVKREGNVEVETEVEPEKPDLRDFKLRPIQNLDLASKRKYQVVGITMEAKYDDMTESEEEREVLRLSKGDQAAHKEIKGFNDCSRVLERTSSRVWSGNSCLCYGVLPWHPVRIS